MNNIEILEEFIEQYNASYPDEKECVAIYPEQIEAIENLIQRNKELEKQIPSPTNPIPVENQTDIWVLKRDYISKSKEIEKKDKIIDKMAERLVEDSDVFNY